jgi:hypothetical protein
MLAQYEERITAELANRMRDDGTFSPRHLDMLIIGANRYRQQLGLGLIRKPEEEF